MEKDTLNSKLVWREAIERLKNTNGEYNGIGGREYLLPPDWKGRDWWEL